MRHADTHGRALCNSPREGRGLVGSIACNVNTTRDTLMKRIALAKARNVGETAPRTGPSVGVARVLGRYRQWATILPT